MSNAQKITCSVCRHFAAYGKFPGGTCRRHAPQPGLSSLDGWWWPEIATPEEAWCSEGASAEGVMVALPASKDNPA